MLTIEVLFEVSKVLYMSIQAKESSKLEEGPIFFKLRLARFVPEIHF